MTTDVHEFIKNFDVVQNAMDMRNLIRWNGRDIRDKENLSEHTHLVVACAIKLYDRFKDSISMNFEQIIRYAVLHDSEELLRGDILSITKDSIPSLRETVDSEEVLFLREVAGSCSDTTLEIVHLADLMACYKFIEYELRYPSNNFAVDIYITTKAKYEHAYVEFCKKYDIQINKPKQCTYRLTKGYREDAGVDIHLTEKVVFMPMSTTAVNLKYVLTPKENEMSLLCARTSAANKGLSVAMCPIDPNYSGEITAIVHNVSNTVVTYDVGEAFCQIITVPFINFTNCNIKKVGKRSTGKLGSTGDVK